MRASSEAEILRRAYYSPRDRKARGTDDSPIHRDRSRGSPPERRQGLSAVGRVASRVRTSSIVRISSAFNVPKTRDTGEGDGEDVDASPWGVGMAAVTTSTDRRGASASPPPLIAIPEAAVGDPASASASASVSPHSSAVSVPSPVPTALPLSIPPSRTQKQTTLNMGIDNLSPQSVGSDRQPDNRVTTRDRARPGKQLRSNSSRNPGMRMSLDNAFLTMMAVPAQNSPVSSPVGVTETNESPTAHPPVSPADSTPNRRISKVAFRPTGETASTGHLVTSARERDMSSEVLAASRDVSDADTVATHSTEKSILRNFNIIGRAKMRHDEKSQRGPLMERCSSSSAVIPSNLITVSSGEGGDRAESQLSEVMRLPTRTNENRKLRTRREKTDTRTRRMSGWFSLLAGITNDPPINETKEKRYWRRPGQRNHADGYPQTNERKSGFLNRAHYEPENTERKKKDMSEMDFADDELYDSDEDEERVRSGEDVTVPSLARDDFVAYQTAQKQKGKERNRPRVSMMRL